MFGNSRKNRQRSTSQTRPHSYEGLEERNLLAVTAVFSGGELLVTLDQAMDEAIVSTNGSDVTVNGELVDADLKMNDVQAVTVGDISNLSFVGTKGLDDLSVQLNGVFNDGTLETLSLTNINSVVLEGTYVTNQLTGNLVGSDGLFSGAGQITVNGMTQLQSSDSYNISLQNVNNDFVGNVNVSTAGSVSLADANDIVLGNVSVQNLTLSAPSTITDALNSSVSVPGTSTFTAGSVELGNNGNSVNLLAVISNTSGAFELNEFDQFVWANNSTVGSANIVAGGLVNLGPSANINVIGDAVFSAPSLRLGVGGSNTFNTGRISVNTTSNAFIWENSAVELFGNNSAADLDILATGNVTNAENAVITVFGITSIQSTTSVSIGNAAGDTFNTGFLEFYGLNSVNISEDSSTAIAGMANFADSLIINSNGMITDTGDAFVFVQNNATFISAVDDMMEDAGVVLGDEAGDFFSAGSVSFDVTEGSFVLSENGGTIISSLNGFVNTARVAAISASQNVVNANGAIINVAMTASFAGQNITIGQSADDNVQFGSVNVNSGGNVTVAQDNSIQLTGNSTVVGNLVLNSLGGSVGDSNSSRLEVGGQATFIALTDIEIGDLDAPMDKNGMGDIFDAGTLRFFASGDVDITQDGDIVLAGNTNHRSGDQVQLTAIGNMDDVGSISNLAGADIRLPGNLILSGLGNISLGTNVGDVLNFGDLNFNTLASIELNAIFDDEESEFFIFGSNTANELILTTNVDVNDGTNAIIDITSLIEITGRNITLGDTATDCLMYPLENSQFITTDAAPNVSLPDPACP